MKETIKISFLFYDPKLFIKDTGLIKDLMKTIMNRDHGLTAH